MLAIAFAARITLAVSLGLATGLVCGQNSPNAPLRIVTVAPGGGGDLIARLIAQGIACPLGQQVVVDNRGGSVIIPAGVVAKAPPDGNTLLLYGSNFWLLPFLQDNAPYDPVKDFLPVTMATNAPNVLVVNSSLPVKSVKDLITLAKTRPGEFNYGSIGFGSPSNLAMELFKSMAGVDIVHVPFKGVAQAYNDIAAGGVQMMIGSFAATVPYVKSGRLTVLAVTSAEPSSLYPNLPTVAASGLPGFETGSSVALFAPAKTPATNITRLNTAVVRALRKAEVQEKLASIGIETVGSSPAELAATIKSEMATLGKLIRDLGIRDPAN